MNCFITFIDNTKYVSTILIAQKKILLIHFKSDIQLILVKSMSFSSVIRSTTLHKFH